MLTFKEFLTESRFEGIVDNPSFNDLKGILANSKNKHVKFIARHDKITRASGDEIIHQQMLPDHIQKTMKNCDSPTPNYPHMRGEIYTGWESGKLSGGLYSRGDNGEALQVSDDHPIVQKMKQMGVKITHYYTGDSES